MIIINNNFNSYGSKTTHLLRSYLTTNDGFAASDILFYNLIEGTIEECNETASTIRSTYPDGGVIIISAEDSYTLNIYNALQMNNVTSKNNYDIIYFYLDEITAFYNNVFVFIYLYFKQIENVSFLSHYYNGYSFNGYTDKILNSFKEKIREMSGLDLPMTSTLAIGYDAFQQWANAYIINYYY